MRSLWKTVSFLLIAAMFTGLCSAGAVQAKEKKQYVIVIKNGKEKKVKEKYKNKSGKKTVANLSESSKVLTLELTEEEAENLLRDPDVAAVSEDGEVVAFGNEKEKDKEKEKNKDKDKDKNKNKDKDKDKNKEKKIKSHGKISENLDNVNWNIRMIHADNVVQDGTVNQGNKVKIAILDSGVDDTEDIAVHKRKNFVPGEEEVIPAFDDPTGHGTAIAGIVASSGETSGYRGVNPNVELYSAKIFDFSMAAPVSRVVEAIHWAMEEDVDIINLSFGTPTPSAALEYAVREAHQAGILIVAAAGNNGVVEYPAGYPEVVAVGSVNSQAEIAEKSAVGDSLELLAPGELVASVSHFGGVAVESGSSFAAPHVAGAASVLMQQDLSVSGEFIRRVLDLSANSQLSDGYGLLDLERALEVYASLRADGTDTVDLQAPGDGVEENEKVLDVFENDFVEGSWAKQKHEELVAKSDPAKHINSVNSTLFKCLKAGARANDDYIPGMVDYPELHGWAYHTDGTGNNYMACYFLLIDMAQNVYSNGTIKIAQPSYIADASYNTITGKISDSGLGVTSWEAIFSKWGLGAVNNAKKCAFLYGMAAHIVTDLFAHSAYVPDGKEGYTHIVHDTGADVDTIYPNRISCAGEIAGIVAGHYYTSSNNLKTDGSVADFVLKSYNETFQIRNLGYYASKLNGTIYKENEAYFNKINNSAQ